MAVRADQIVTEFRGDTRHLDSAFRHSENQVAGWAKRVSPHLGNVQKVLSGQSIKGEGLLSTLSDISNIIQAIPAIGNMAGALVRPLTDAAQEGLRLNMVIEGAEIGFEGVAGSADKAKQHIADMRRFAQASPIFEFEPLIRTSRLMTAFGFQIQDHISLIKTWGSVIASQGEVSADALEGVARAFGQIRSKGRVQAEEMEQLAERGFPAWELLARAIGKTVAETRKLSEMGRLRGPQAVEAITAMAAEDPRFKGLPERLAGTLRGRLNRLQEVRQEALQTAMQGTAGEISLAVEGALRQEDLAARMAGGINTALTPVAGLIRAGIVSTIGGGLTLGFQDAFSAATAVLPADVMKMGTEGILSPLKGVLGIQSPSHITYGYGLMLAQGLSDGLSDGLRGQRSRLERAAENDVVKAFFEAIKKAEGGAPNRIVGGRTVSDLSRHPNIVGMVGPAGPSTAAGSWQMTGTNWRRIAPMLGLTDFSEHSQMLAALQLLDEAGGLDRLMGGDISGATRAAGKHWAALPGPLPGRKVSSSQFMKWFQKAQGGSSLPSGLDLFGMSDSLAVRGQKPGRGPRADAVPVEIVGVASNIAASLAGFGVGERVEFGKVPVRDFAGNVMGYNTFDPTEAGLPTPSGFDASLVRLTPGITNFIGLAKSGTDAHFELLKAIGQVGPEAEKSFGQASLAAGEWGEKVIDSGKKASFLGITGADAAYALESSWTSAFTNLEGGFKGMTSRFVIGFAEMINQMAQQWAASQVSQLLGSVFSAIGGAIFGGGGGLPKAAGFNPSLVPLTAPRFASGTPYAPAGWALVGEQGAELVRLKGGERVYDADETRRMMGGQKVTNNTTIIVQAPRQPSLGYTPKRAQREYAEMLGAVLQRRFA